MSDRNKPHNGRDRSGHFKVKREDVDDLTMDPKGPEYLKDDVRLGGAVEDTGALAGQRAARIGEIIENNREDVERATGTEEETR